MATRSQVSYSAWRHRLFVAALVCFLSVRTGACGGSATCGGSPLPGGLPVAEERVGAMQVRITRQGLDWVSDNAKGILEQFVPAGLNFQIGQSSQLGGLVVICPADTNPSGCPFQADLNEATLEPAPPDALKATLYVDIPKQDIPVRAFGSDCVVTVEALRTPVPARLAFALDPVTRALNLSPTVETLTGANMNITGTGLCATVTIFQGVVLGEMQQEVQKTLVETLEDRICTPCANGCPGGTTCGARSLCRHANETCVAQRQGLAGEYDLAPLFGRVSIERLMPVRYGLALGGNAAVDNAGLTMGGMGGAGTRLPSNCVPAGPPRAITPVPAPSFPAQTPGGQDYHVALALSKEVIEDAASAIRKTGGFCLLPTTELVPQLTTDAFALVLPALGKLTDGRSQRVILGVKLDAEPRAAIGPGTSHVDGRGQRVLDEPLISLTLADLVLDIYTRVEDRVVRVGRVIQDVTLPLGLDFLPGGQVGVLIGDTAGAVSNVRVPHAELLGATQDSLRSAVPALVALALPSVLQSLRPIELPSFSGFGLDPIEARGIPAGGETHAAIFANLKLVEPPLPMRAVARTTARLLSIRPGTLEVAFGGTAPSSDDRLEWSWRLGDGLWSPYTTSARVRIEDPRLRLITEHRFQVRARAMGRPGTLDPAPATLTLRVSPPAPPSAAPEASGCQASDSAPSGGLCALILLLVGWIVRRRSQPSA